MANGDPGRHGARLYGSCLGPSNTHPARPGFGRAVTATVATVRHRRLAVFAVAAGAFTGCGDANERLSPAPPAVAFVDPAPQKERGPRVRDDAEASESFPVSDPSKLTERAPDPEAAKPAKPAATAASAADGRSPGAPSDAQIKRELQEMDRALESYDSGSSGSATGKATLNRDGTASPPNGAPEAVRRIIAAGNAIAKFPYVYGGGHASFIDTAYDCSGSISYALRAAGLVERPMVSGEFAESGEPGPGKWVTIYANEGHMFMVVAGLRYDTSGRGGPLGSRWQTSKRSTEDLEVRHPPGL